MGFSQMPQPGDPIKLGEFLLEKRKFPAVYFLHYRGVCVYVGQSRTLTARINQHLEDGVKQFDAVSFVRCPFNRLTETEARFIKDLAPKYNACSTAKKAKERRSWQKGDYIPGQNVRYVINPPPADGEPLLASNMFVPPEDLGDFFGVTDADAAEWYNAGEITDLSVLGLMYFHARNHRKVNRAIEKFAAL